MKEEAQEFEIKKWEFSPAVNHQQEAHVPQAQQSITISPTIVRGAPLILSFENIFL